MRNPLNVDFCVGLFSFQRPTAGTALEKRSRKTGDFRLGAAEMSTFDNISVFASLPPPQNPSDRRFFEQGVPSRVMVRPKAFAGKSVVDRQSTRIAQVTSNSTEMDRPPTARLRRTPGTMPLPIDCWLRFAQASPGGCLRLLRSSMRDRRVS